MFGPIEFWTKKRDYYFLTPFWPLFDPFWPLFGPFDPLFWNMDPNVTPSEPGSAGFDPWDQSPRGKTALEEPLSRWGVLSECDIEKVVSF